jgi:hypothetical protein
MSEPTVTVPRTDIRLADFIRQNIEPIVAEWISFARTRTPAGDNMTALALQDHVVEILQFIADDIETVQSETQQVAKSRGLGPDDSPFTQTAAEIHATLRLADGFNIDQMVSEYRALRASVVKQWVARNRLTGKAGGGQASGAGNCVKPGKQIAGRAEVQGGGIAVGGPVGAVGPSLLLRTISHRAAGSRRTKPQGRTQTANTGTKRSDLPLWPAPRLMEGAFHPLSDRIGISPAANPGSKARAAPMLLVPQALGPVVNDRPAIVFIGVFSGAQQSVKPESAQGVGPSLLPRSTGAMVRGAIPAWTLTPLRAA